ncbi:hypothetical protein NP493_226g02027 [Ridgeia piscesae]|uniref:Uncharacterized protein n=1 Tax=Ridgeia piscesae TaxID=27915 RepID=A0AAD9P063_RIDPI|nr:hypothetical protein NP493_226g02027 [Ridgeia piscesae]
MLIVTCFLCFLYRQMRMYSKMPGSWYAVLSKTVNSHNVIDIQADVVHQKMSNLSYSVERAWHPPFHHQMQS